MNAAQFRAEYPEFGDEVVYPDLAVNVQLSMAAKRLPADRWDDLLEHGTGLFVAHHLALNARNRIAADRGKVPGSMPMPQSAKSVDKVSASYDTESVLLTDGGHWNATSYGVQFLQLSRMVGAGGVQL